MLSAIPQDFPFGDSIFPMQGENPSTHHGDVAKIKEPRVSFLEKFDGMRSKFQGIVNQI